MLWKWWVWVLHCSNNFDGTPLALTAWTSHGNWKTAQSDMVDKLFVMGRKHSRLQVHVVQHPQELPSQITVKVVREDLTHSPSPDEPWRRRSSAGQDRRVVDRKDCGSTLLLGAGHINPWFFSPGLLLLFLQWNFNVICTESLARSTRPGLPWGPIPDKLGF